MKVVRKIIEIDEEKCTGCGNCVVACAEGAIAIVDGKAKIIKDLLCDGLGACMGECPEDALRIIEREADEFDEEAVHEHLNKVKKNTLKLEPMGCGCPSSQIKEFGASHDCQCSGGNAEVSGEKSALSHWPVQIKLVPPTAPFLNGADLLIAADCTTVAYPSIHKDFLPGRKIMIGCPKFDNAEEYVEKFTEIFKIANLKSITVLLMEVPCCSALNTIVEKALAHSGKDIPMKSFVVGREGRIL